MNERSDSDNLEYLLNGSLDGSLTGQAKADLERRLTEDAELRQELRRYKTLSEHLHAAEVPELEDIDYAAQRAEIMAAIERKVLLTGPPRRRAARAGRVIGRIWPAAARLVAIRPAALAAAAVLVIGASVGLLLFGPAGPAEGGPELAVAVLPETPAALGPPELAVRLMRLEIGSLALAMRPTATAIPSGTVLVSIGRRNDVSPDMFPAELFGIQ